MESQQMYMFPEARVAKMEDDLNNMRRAIFARINEIEKEMKNVSATCEGNVIDFIEIKKILQEAYQAVI